MKTIFLGGLVTLALGIASCKKHEPAPPQTGSLSCSDKILGNYYGYSYDSASTYGIGMRYYGPSADRMIHIHFWDQIYFDALFHYDCPADESVFNIDTIAGNFNNMDLINLGDDAGTPQVEGRFSNNGRTLHLYFKLDNTRYIPSTETPQITYYHMQLEK